jgi:exosortase family protein XrtF
MRVSDYKPALRFLGYFLGSYFVLNLIYGVWIESLGKNPDALTYLVSFQSGEVLDTFGYDASVVPNQTEPKVALMNYGQTVINVFEGCNGVNVFIVFFSFIVAFGGRINRMLWFIPVGIVVIHVSNLFRILFLFWLAEQGSTYFYYFHKYLFTAAIYAVVFVLWWIWIKNLSIRSNATT